MFQRGPNEVRTERGRKKKVPDVMENFQGDCALAEVQILTCWRNIASEGTSNLGVETDLASQGGVTSRKLH